MAPQKGVNFEYSALRCKCVVWRGHPIGNGTCFENKRAVKGLRGSNPLLSATVCWVQAWLEVTKMVVGW